MFNASRNSVFSYPSFSFHQIIHEYVDDLISFARVVAEFDHVANFKSHIFSQSYERIFKVSHLK